MKTTKNTKRRSVRTTAPVPPAGKAVAPQPAAARTGTDAPVTSTPDFKAGKDL